MNKAQKQRFFFMSIYGKKALYFGEGEFLTQDKKLGNNSQPIDK